jgi:hypothetical protein
MGTLAHVAYLTAGFLIAGSFAVRLMRRRLIS